MVEEMVEDAQEVTFDSQPSDGLLGVVTQAQKTVLAASDEPIGVLAIELMVPQGGGYRVAAPSDLALGVEVAYTEHEGAGVIERLDLHVARDLPGPPDAALVRAALAEQGGTEFTNLCISRPDEGEICDVTLHFGSRLKILAQHTALIEPELSATDVDGALAVLHELAIAARPRGKTFVVPRRALRSAPTPEAQARAFFRALEKKLGIALYASTLPITRAVRLAARPEGDAWRFGLVLSRHLAPESRGAAQDAVALRDFVKSQFDFDFGAQRWRVENAHGMRAAHRPHGPVPHRKALSWSLNWGTRKG